MSELTFKGFKGIEPVTDACLQDAPVAQIAHNVKLWHGRLDPWRAPKLIKEVIGACSAHIRDCCWRVSADPCTRYVDVLCGPTILSSPTTLPSVIQDFCNADEQICPLGFPCPEKPTATQITSSEPCHMSEVRAYMITYGDECVYGAPSMLTEPVYCSNKDDTFVLQLPQPPAVYCNVTKIRIYRLVTTTNPENSHRHGSREHREQGFSDPNAVDASCFEVGCVDVGTTTFTDDGGVTPDQLCDEVVSGDWDEPPCGLVVHGMFDSGALVGSIGNKLRFSEFNTHHAWPCKYELSFECEIVTVCVCADFAFVFTTQGVSVVSDTIEALDNFCRPKRDIKRSLPLCNHKAVICTDGQAVFASRTGLYRVDSSGQVQNLTGTMGTDNWAEVEPNSVRLGLYDNRLMITSNRFSGVYDIDLFGDGSPASNTLSTIDVCPACWINDKQGNLYMLSGDGIHQWDAGDQYMDMHWRSGHRSYKGLGYITAARVNYSSPQSRKVTKVASNQMTIWADGCAVYTRSVNHSNPIRTPRCKASELAVEIRGRRSVSSATLAASIRCMSQV